MFEINKTLYRILKYLRVLKLNLLIQNFGWVEAMPDLTPLQFSTP